MVKVIPSILLLFSVLVTNAQVVISDSLSTDDLRGCWSEYNELACIPLLYNVMVPIDGNGENVSVKVGECKFRALLESEEKMTQWITLDTALHIDSKIVTTRKKKSLQLSFSPFIKNNGGQILALSEYQFEIDEMKMPVRKMANSQDRKNSMLSSGKWYKIKVDTSGVYKLTYEDLKKIGLQEPGHTRVFSYGGRQLSYYCSNDALDDLNEIPVIVESGSDGVFGSGDYLAFYAEGPVVLNYDEEMSMFIHEKHCYSDYAYLFLTSDFGDALLMETVKTETSQADAVVDSYDCYGYMEDDKYNLVSSGRRWYDSKLNTNKMDSALFYIPNIDKNEDVKVYASSAGHKGAGVSSTYFKYTYQGRQASSVTVSKPFDSYMYGDFCETQFGFKAKSSKIHIGYGFFSPSTLWEGYMDKICVNARASLSYNGKSQLAFRDSRSKDVPFVKYSINDGGQAMMVLDVTTPTSPKLMSLEKKGTVSSFVASADGTIREFVAFESGNLRSPIISGDDLGSIENQNIHGAQTPDMLIVSYPDFLSQAEELADLHRSVDGFDVLVLTQQQIFNEFSGGAPDVSAIRNCAKMFYDRDDKFKYLLLFGDGTYDNKNILKSNSNFILTYQSKLGESRTGSYVCDDFFAMLDEGEGEMTGTIDVGIGRLPASSTDEAQLMVDKIRRYLFSQDHGSWRNAITFIADDEEGGVFVSDAENLSMTIKSVSPEYNVNKIYLDAYEQVSGSSGARYPEVTEAIKKQFAMGSAIVQYIGHSNPTKIAHESIFLSNDVKNIDNGGRLPFVITASCETGQFDNHTLVSFGECFLKENNKNTIGGAIAVFTTTRVVYDNQNYELCKNLYAQGTKESLRLGDLVMNAKNATLPVDNTNKRSFVLLGDPALRLAHPYNNNIQVEKVNGQPVDGSVVLDTINAVDTVNIEGYAFGNDGKPVADDGVLYVTVFDKPVTTFTRGNDSDSPIIDFEEQNSVLYQGKASIVDGKFNFSFIVPKDINYSYGNGKISLYATVGQTEMSGYSNKIVIGGTPRNASILDTEGPEIQLFVTDTFFVDGSVVGNNPVLIAKLYDESGINTTGNGIGHNITAVLDDDQHTMLILNDYYEGYIDQYNSGEVRFRLNDLEEGEHTLTFKAWDIYNNPSEMEITFIVKDESSVAIGSVYNYPNPANADTYFVVNHNATNENIDITITVSDLSGRTIAVLKDKRESGDTSPIHWNCQHNGRLLDCGIYIYTVEISGKSGKNFKSGKMILSRQ